MQANKCLKSCGEAPHSVQMSFVYSLAINGSVLTEAVRECIVVFGSVSIPRLILGVEPPLFLCCFFGAE